MADDIAMNRLYLDSTVIKAAHEEDHPHRSAALWLLDQVRTGELAIAVSDLTWIELTGDPASSMTAASFREMGIPTLPATGIAERGPQGHRAVMAAAGLSAILSFDPHYDSFDELTRVDPEALRAAEQAP